MKCGNSENLKPRRETLHPWCRQAWIAFKKNRSFPTLHDFDCELSEDFLESLLIVGANDWLRMSALLPSYAVCNDGQGIDLLSRVLRFQQVCDVA